MLLSSVGYTVRNMSQTGPKKNRFSRTDPTNYKRIQHVGPIFRKGSAESDSLKIFESTDSETR